MILKFYRVLSVLILADRLLSLLSCSEVVDCFLLDLLVHVEQIRNQDPSLHFLREKLFLLLLKQVIEHSYTVLVHILSQLHRLRRLAQALLLISLDFIS
jgi:hypothetical protein